MTLESFVINVLPFILFLAIAVWFTFTLRMKNSKYLDLCNKSQATQEQIAETLLEIKQLLEKK